MREFRRGTPEFGSLLCYLGRPISVQEFNAVEAKIITTHSASQFGVMPRVKLIEVADAEPLGNQALDSLLQCQMGASAADLVPPVPVASDTPPSLDVVPPPPALAGSPALSVIVVLPENVAVEPIEGGFVICDYRAESSAQFLGTGEAGWQSDVSLAAPFASEAEALDAFGQLEPACVQQVENTAADEVPAVDAAPAPKTQGRSHKKKK